MIGLVELKVAPWEEVRGILEGYEREVDAISHRDKLKVSIKVSRTVTLMIQEGELEGELPKIGSRVGLLRTGGGYRVTRLEGYLQ